MSIQSKMAIVGRQDFLGMVTDHMGVGVYVVGHLRRQKVACTMSAHRGQHCLLLNSSFSLVSATYCRRRDCNPQTALPCA